MQEKSKTVSLANTRLGVSVFGVGPFFFLSGNDTRRYLGSRIFIQPVCLYSSVLYAILFSLYVNQLHDGRSKCLPRVMMMNARADNDASGKDQRGRSNPVLLSNFCQELGTLSVVFVLHYQRGAICSYAPSEQKGLGELSVHTCTYIT